MKFSVNLGSAALSYKHEQLSSPEALQGRPGHLGVKTLPAHRLRPEGRLFAPHCSAEGTGAFERCGVKSAGAGVTFLDAVYPVEEIPFDCPFAEISVRDGVAFYRTCLPPVFRLSRDVPRFVLI